MPVIRQEDIGIDFHCVVTKKKDRYKITFGAPFGVQVGSIDGKEFVFGGFPKDDAKKERWRKEGVEWLFAQEVPFFVCTVDRTDSAFRLYSTSPMWLMRINYPTMTEVVLMPDKTHDPLRASRSAEKLDDKGNGDGFSYAVPLGPPIVQLTMADLEDKEEKVLSRAREALSFAAFYDQVNITYRRSGIQACYWFTNIVPNDVSSLHTMGGGIAPSDHPSLLDVLKAASLSMALSLAQKPDKEKIEKLAPVFALFPPDQIPDWIEPELPVEVQSVIQAERAKIVPPPVA